MRFRVLVLTIAVGMISLLTAGCGTQKTEPVPVTDGFRCEAAVTYRDMEICGTLYRQTDGKMAVTFSAPKSLSGVTVGWNGEEMTLELAGMSIAVSPEKVPHSALVKSLLDVLASPQTAGEMTDEGYVLTGEADGRAYTLVCDPQTGLPRSLSVPDDEISAVFTNAERLSDEPSAAE